MHGEPIAHTIEYVTPQLLAEAFGVVRVEHGVTQITSPGDWCGAK